MNATIELTTEQLIDFIQQMPPKEKRAVLVALAERTSVGEEERMKYAESQVRQLCASRGLNWDTMTEEEREDFIDDLVHEDRECS
ncbi:hypothetical protein F4Y59_08555 [Candidatus Poribacteria bacterium]|nr:hypothetical protein [Candidatus Poribacteria bacterium]MXY28193.1 hypothetical protein [Candidatus Poribacteria bacterium]RKU35875.1 MAG: hypothetical protein C6496_16395 [Candidatus Poribacteria bacterium]